MPARGFTLHENGLGPLRMNFRERNSLDNYAYVTMADSNSIMGSMTSPSLLTALVISSVARIDATVVQIKEMAIYRPGQILKDFQAADVCGNMH